MNVKDLRRGMSFLHENRIQIVLDISHSKKARGSAVTRLKVRSIPDNVVKPITFTGDVDVKQVILEKIKYTYIYSESGTYFFMNVNDYEQIGVPLNILEWEKNFLVADMTVEITMYNGEFVKVTLPEKVKIKVVEAPPAVKGDSVNNPQKDIVLETGFQIKAPLFINPNEYVLVNTETGKYDGRAQG